jgi:hypothetical protein
MGRAFKAFTPLTITSSGSLTTNAVWGFDDAVAVRVFISTAVAGTVFNVQVCPGFSSGQFPEAYQVNLSSAFYTMQSVQTSAGTVVGILPGQSVAIPCDEGAAFNQLRLLGTGAETSGRVCGWVTASIYV